MNKFAKLLATVQAMTAGSDVNRVLAFNPRCLLPKRKTRTRAQRQRQLQRRARRYAQWKSS